MAPREDWVLRRTVRLNSRHIDPERDPDHIQAGTSPLFDRHHDGSGGAVMDPRFAEAIGYLGALLVFLAFWTRDMVPLRIVAIASNVAFMIYGTVTGATPIMLLHAALLPLNMLRLIENVRAILAR